MLQSPEDAVRERYGLPWQTEEEYEAACKSNRKFQGLTPFTELQEWSKYYYEEDAVFEEKVKQYDMINNTLQKLAFGVMYNKGNDENAMKKLLIESGYGDNEEQCKALIEGLKNKKIGSAGLDVYEEEGEYFYEDQSDRIIDDDVLARLLSFNNVIVTSHQAFFTREALENIATTTLQNIKDFASGKALENEVKI